MSGNCLAAAQVPMVRAVGEEVPIPRQMLDPGYAGCHRLCREGTDGPLPDGRLVSTGRILKKRRSTAVTDPLTGAFRLPFEDEDQFDGEFTTRIKSTAILIWSRPRETISTRAANAKHLEATPPKRMRIARRNYLNTTRQAL